MTEVRVASSEACGAATAAAHRYLTMRAGFYYFKRKIPKAIVEAKGLKSDQCWRSLDTTILEVALPRLEQAKRVFDAEYSSTCVPEKCERGSPQSSHSSDRVVLAEAHLPHLLERFEFAHLVTDDDDRRSMSPAEREARLRSFEVGLQAKYEQSAAEDLSEHEDLAAELLRHEGLTCSRGTPLWTRFVSELLAKDITVLQLQCGRLRGQRTVTPSAVPRAPRAMASVRDLFEAWKLTQPLTRTAEDHLRFIDAFEEMFGVVPVEALTSEEACTFRDALHVRGLALVTIKNYIGGLSAIVNFGVSENICRANNPFQNVSYRAVPAKPASDDRRAYEGHELEKLFSSQLFISRSVPRGQAQESAYWAPLLCLFFGGRIEEIAQLRVEDVQCVDRIWVLRICDLDVNQRLKTESSYRLVPLHNEMIRLGFLAYVAEQKLAGQTRLFPSQKNDNKHGIWSNALGKFFSRHLREIGLEDRRLCFHSFRYTFKQRCAMLGISEEIRDALTGHWLCRTNAGRVYLARPGRQYPLQALKRAIDTLEYAELDLRHLHAAEPLRGVDRALNREWTAIAAAAL